MEELVTFLNHVNFCINHYVSYTFSNEYTRKLLKGDAIFDSPV